MKALTPARVTSRTGLPAYLDATSRRSASNHVMRPGIALRANLQRAGRVPDFATNEQARRHIPPNRVRHPADRQFASGCSPPRLAATQLPPATGLWLTPTRTSTVPLRRLYGRTHSGAGRNPDSPLSQFPPTLSISSCPLVPFVDNLFFFFVFLRALRGKVFQPKPHHPPTI